LSDELLAIEQGHWANVIGHAFVNKNVVVRRWIVAGAVVKCVEGGEG